MGFLLNLRRAACVKYTGFVLWVCGHDWSLKLLKSTSIDGKKYELRL